MELADRLEQARKTCQASMSCGPLDAHLANSLSYEGHLRALNRDGELEWLLRALHAMFPRGAASPNDIQVRSAVPALYDAYRAVVEAASRG